MPKTYIPSVLIPLRVLEGETVSPGTADLLRDARVVLLGYHDFPEQTSPDQAREQFEEPAREKLEDVLAIFSNPEKVETRIVFTHDPEQTIDRVADETGCDTYLITNPSQDIDDLLFPLHGDVDIPRTSAVIAGLVAGRDVDITLYAAVRDEEAAEAAEPLFSEAHTALTDAGVHPDRISTETEVTANVVRITAEAATRADFVVMGERAPSLHSLIFGVDTEQVAELSVGPVLVVRRELPEEEVEAE